MRIAIIASPWAAIPPLGYGGTEAVIDGLARGLHAAGHDVVLFATGDSTCPVPRDWVIETAVGVDAARPATELHHVINAYEALADEVDIVHDHTLTGPLYAQRFPDLHVVTTNHGPFSGELADYYRAIADTVPIIAISHHQASTAVDTRVAGVIHHGVDVDRFPAGLGRGGYVLFLGRMHPDKGVHTAIKVARAAGIPLRIACKMQEAAEVAYYDAVVEPLLGSDIEFVGEVGGADKLALLADARCLVNPIAWAEPFGMVMIEAMACGTPVVATPMGAASEIITPGVTGFLATTIEQLAVAVSAARKLDRAACRRLAAKRFSIGRMAADHARIYQSIVEPSATAHVA